ncbi:hypothetical protein BDF14DRAFT_1800548 [Spinellus fusiger]|nr:hypothetical protein BDF14DRAFT_1800492 [Spinellus fusiger]KAI7867660.1 hypothetical protein BDF14DRAFT_1800548 [Spinellus fusiger]
MHLKLFTVATIVCLIAVGAHAAAIPQAKNFSPEKVDPICSLPGNVPGNVPHSTPEPAPLKDEDFEERKKLLDDYGDILL